MSEESRARLLVVSVDAMQIDDLPFARTLPGFSRILAQASVAEIEGVFPTNTYPSHAAQITGCPPAVNGVYNNEQFQPERGTRPEWFWDSRLLQVPTIFSAARQAGLTTASVQWPVTGNDPNVDWLIPEIASPWLFTGLEDQYRQTTNAASLERYILPNLGLIRDRPRPRYVRFVSEVSTEILRTERPDLMLAHLVELDFARHAHGTYGPHVQQALREVDVTLCRYLEVLEADGLLDTTNIAIVSDHGHLDLVQHTSLNAVFADRGFLHIADDGSVADYDVFCLGAGLSGQLFLGPQTTPDRRREVEELLDEIEADPQYRIRRIWTSDETREAFGLDGPFEWVVESDPGVSVGSSWTRRPVMRDGEPDFDSGRGSHGHLPAYGGQPLFIATGPAFEAGLDLGRRSMLAEAPTFAAVLGLSLPDATEPAMTDVLTGAMADL